MSLPAFGVEQWLNAHETKAVFDLSQSTIAALSLNELLTIHMPKAHLPKAHLPKAHLPEAHLPEADAAVKEFFASYADVTLNYGDIEGSQAFKTLVSGLYKNVLPQHILQTNGGTGANLAALFALVRPGDHVIALWPSYQQLCDLPRALGAEVSLVQLREASGWHVDIDEVIAHIQPNTRLITLCNANNPTATALPHHALCALAEAARKNGIYILVDEVFRSLDPSIDQNGTMTSIADIYERGVSTNSLSKMFSVPGIRVGWTASGKEAADSIRHVRDYTMISCGILNNALAEYVLRSKDALLARNRAIVTSRHAMLAQWIQSQSRLSCALPQSTPFAFVKIATEKPIEQFCAELLQKTGVLLVPGSCFGIEGYVRLGHCVSDEHILKKGLDAISDYLS